MSVPIVEQPDFRLDQIGNGALMERFDREAQKVLSNIKDPNSDHKKSSTITVKVTLKPNEKRQIAAISYNVTSTMAPSRPIDSTIMIDNDKGLIVAKEIGNEVPGQIGMNVSQFDREAK